MARVQQPLVPSGRGSPQRTRPATVAGLCYLAVIAGGLFAEGVVRQSLVVPGDAAATARAILENGATLATLEDAPTLIYLATRLFATGFGFSLLLFAGFCVLIGALILRSRLVPRAIGAMMIVAGICYVVNTVALIVSPGFWKLVNPTILLPILLAELSLALWLLLKGITVEAK